MKIVGIVCEYNPFHNGHQRQLQAVHAAGGTAVCLMSGNYVQRGEPAILEKHVRAAAAVDCGADLVLELPVTYALRSAEGFAAGGVELLGRMGCVEALCFGSECGDAADIMAAARLLLSEAFSVALRRELEAGCSFPAARQRAVERMGAPEIAARLLARPNATLAVEYCKAMLCQESCLKPMVLRRNGDYHDGTDRDAPSAGFLRGRRDWTGFVPEEALARFSSAPRYTLAAGERAVSARLRGMEDADFAALPYGSEGLWRRVLHACRSCATVEEILEAAKSKRYTRTRLMRMLLCAYLGISKTCLAVPAPYVRVLAMRESGQAVLKAARAEGSLPLLHAGERPPESAYAALERRADDLYGLFCAAAPSPPGAGGRVYRRAAEE